MPQENRGVGVPQIVKSSDDGVVFPNAGGQSVTVDPARVFLILKEIVLTRKETAVRKIQTKINLPATLLTGGIPIQRRVTENTIIPDNPRIKDEYNDLTAAWHGNTITAKGNDGC